MSNRPLDLDLPHGETATTDLSLAADVRVDPDTALWLLEDLIAFPFLRGDRTLDWPRARALATHVAARARGWYLDLEIGHPPDRATVQGSFFDAQNAHLLRMKCKGCVDPVCAHKLALGLALAARDPSWRKRLLEPAWARYLAPLTAAAPAAAAPAADERPAGWIRVVLHATPDGESEIAGGRVSVMLVPLSRRSGEPLKPRRAPRSIDAVESKIRGLSEGDRGFLRLLEQHRLLDHIGTYRYSDSTRVNDELARIERDIFAAFAAVTEVFFDEQPLTVDPRPWCTALRVTDDRHGGLALRWTERPQAIFPVGDGWIIDDANHLRPLDPRLSLDALALLERPSPRARRRHRHPSSTARARHRPPRRESTPAASPPGRHPHPRLVLRDDGGTLPPRSGTAYSPTEIDRAGPPSSAPPFTGRRVLIRRDRAAEEAHARALAALLPDKPLRGEVAYDFLLDALPRLEGWEITAVQPRPPQAPPRRHPRRRAPPQERPRLVRPRRPLRRRRADRHPRRRPPHLARRPPLRRAPRRQRRPPPRSLARPPRRDPHRARRDPRPQEAARRPRRPRRRRAPRRDPRSATATLDRWRALAARIRTFDGVPDRPLPPGLRATLRDYQHRGYRWIAALGDLGLGGVLADDMGLGKTLQTLTALLDLHRPTGARGGAKPAPSLVVAPTSVVHNWIAEAARFTPALTVHLHHGPRRGDPPQDVDLVVTSYALLRVDQERLAGPWRMVVLDEAQHIKNPASRIAQAARALEAERRLALTGTPLENHLIELWSIFEYLMPGFFGSRRAYADRYVRPVQRETDPEARARALDHLRRRIRPFVLRRLKREVAAELPPRQEQILYCDLGPTERRLYEAVKHTYRDTVLGQVDAQGLGQSTIQILEALTRLRQAACDARLLPFPEAQIVEHSAKRTLLRQTLQSVIDEGHRALVFSQWPSLLKRVVTDLETLGVDHLYLDGSTTERGNLQARWNDPSGPPVFLISLKAGGTGLNLIGADLVIHLDPWWNPQVEAQATDRAHRIGQTKPVMVYKLVARGTVEEKILELQDRKRSLFEAAVDGDRVAVDALTRADLEAVLAADDAALYAADEVGEVVSDDRDDSVDGIGEDGSDDDEPAPAAALAEPAPVKASKASGKASKGSDKASKASGKAPKASGKAPDLKAPDAKTPADAPKAPADASMAPAAAPEPPAEASPPSRAQAPTAAPTTTPAPAGPALPDAILQALIDAGEISNADVRDRLGVSSAQATRLLNEWLAAGLIRRRGKRYNTRYHLPG
ncbi:MAG: SNF2-related protein [bacterium]